MILNEKSMNYKIVAIHEIYNFHITFISIQSSYERNMFF
jgi:hypothetical protein